MWQVGKLFTQQEVNRQVKDAKDELKAAHKKITTDKVAAQRDKTNKEKAGKLAAEKRVSELQNQLRDKQTALAKCQRTASAASSSSNSGECVRCPRVQEDLKEALQASADLRKDIKLTQMEATLLRQQHAQALAHEAQLTRSAHALLETAREEISQAKQENAKLTGTISGMQAMLPLMKFSPG